ncbi:MAG: arginine N-succinyltransferase [Sphingobium sp.]|nr:arginine N-succinyltransferase [Sphingobium sp.]
MTHVLRPATPGDLEAIYRMAKRTGGGFTNLPPDRAALRSRIADAVAAFGRKEDVLGDDHFFFVLEDSVTGKVIGTCQIFSRVGSIWPFYSYRIGTLTQYSKELDRTFKADTLTLTTELDGSTEVGGLYLHPEERSAGTGALLARSRYLFMAMHRPRFAARTIAELRGAHDEAGGSPFWDGVAGKFFGMSFRDADEFNALHGNQFIADLMPKHPLYLAMLPETALAALGAPHHSGRAAMRMLESEGFVYDNYVDIFDGGPTMIVQTDRIATIQQARGAMVAGIEGAPSGEASIVAAGRLSAFRAAFGNVRPVEDGVIVDPESAGLIRAKIGDTIIFAPR